MKKRMGILAAAVACLAVFSAFAEVVPLGPGLTDHGRPLKEDGWIVPKQEYRDESIHAVLETENRRAPSSSKREMIRIVTVEISDPSQLRTTLSLESYEDPHSSKATEMAKHVNAVVAVNDDHTKYSRFQGYVMRQGVFYQDTLSALEKPQDVLIIDDRGDFHVVVKASTETVEAKLEELKADGRLPVNIITFGPALVIDGEPQECRVEDSIHMMHLPGARTVIGQLGPLKYFVMTVDGAATTHSGMNGTEMGKYIKERFPECTVAYNLDGGDSSKLVFYGQELNYSKGRGKRISGLIYFASAAAEEEGP